MIRVLYTLVPARPDAKECLSPHKHAQFAAGVAAHSQTPTHLTWVGGMESLLRELQKGGGAGLVHLGHLLVGTLECKISLKCGQALTLKSYYFAVHTNFSTFAVHPPPLSNHPLGYGEGSFQGYSSQVPVSHNDFWY